MTFPIVTIAILAKQKEPVLPLYLQCIENLDYPKSNIFLYIRTNDNSDNTEQILSEFIYRVGYKYKSVFFNSSSCDPELKNIAVHDWSSLRRFKIISKIRQDSIDYAINNNSDFYFTADCDNWILPHTLKRLLEWNVSCVGPFLTVNESNTLYSNYHDKVTYDGWFDDSNVYDFIYSRQVKGLIEVDCIHCTYLIRSDVLPFVKYENEEYAQLGNNFEYAAFSKSLRDNGFPQYLDNREIYGKLTLIEEVGTMEEWLKDNIKWQISFFVWLWKMKLMLLKDV